MTIRRNVGGFDRVLRVAGGAILLSGGLDVLAAKVIPCPLLPLLAGLGAYAWGAIVLGLLGLVTGVTGFCVLYVPFGISTARPTSRIAS
jgi:hypothetical protein